MVLSACSTVLAYSMTMLVLNIAVVKCSYKSKCKWETDHANFCTCRNKFYAYNNYLHFN